MLIQDTLLVAVQGQPAEVETITFPDPPEEGRDFVVGEMVKEQFCPWPCWVTEKVFPAMVKVPCLEAVPGFEETE